MKFRFSNWTPSLVLVSALAASACGNKEDSPNPGNADASSTSTGDGGEVPATTSTSTAKPNPSAVKTSTTGTNKPPVGDSGPGPGPVGDGGGSGDGSTPPPPVGDGGELPPPPPSGDLDDLIGAICAWEFKCCDDGERAYRFGPSIADAAACKARFVEELREKNSSNNPFVAGSAKDGLLSTLAYSINLSRVSINEDAVAACTAATLEMDCYSKLPTGEAARCTAAAAGEVTNPCALDALFSPVLEQGDACTPSLGQGSGGANDVECKPGTSCLAADDPDNNTGSAACISRGLIDDSCSTDSECDFGFYCDTTAGCQPQGDEGDDCTYDDDGGTFVHPSSCKAGLSCEPTTSKCVSACSEGYECAGSNLLCPEGLSCIPTFDTEGEEFRLCLPRGSGAQADCDDTADCVDGQYCLEGNCAGQRDIGDDCEVVTDQCVAGAFCDVLTYQCKAYNSPSELCVADGAGGAPECDLSKSVGCIQKFDADPDPEQTGELAGQAYKCRAAKNSNGEDCIGDFECASGKCEVVADLVDGHTATVCTDGADVGDKCDELLDDKDGLRCKAGSFCNADGECEAQLPPGADCEDPDVNDTAKPALCANSGCDDHWGSFICTDLAVPETAGGSGVACDGNE
jgi:hypothetical protein